MVSAERKQSAIIQMTDYKIQTSALCWMQLIYIQQEQNLQIKISTSLCFCLNTEMYAGFLKGQFTQTTKYSKIPSPNYATCFVQVLFYIPSYVYSKSRRCKKTSIRIKYFLILK